MQRQLSSAACLLGKTWGYDDQGVWVTTAAARSSWCGSAVPQRHHGPAEPPEPSPVPSEVAEPPRRRTTKKPAERIESWGEFEPGDGFLVGRNEAGELSISAYALVRYINQTTTDATFTDHLGNERPIDTRQDIFPHRHRSSSRGGSAIPKLVYNIFVWTVNTTDQDALFGNLGYQFGRKFSLYGGINGFPGTRSLQGSHPLWLGQRSGDGRRVLPALLLVRRLGAGRAHPRALVQRHDRQQPERAGDQGGRPRPQDGRRRLRCGGCRRPTSSAPRAPYGDWEWHEDLATRFGISSTRSTENRQTDPITDPSNNTTIRLADSLNVFDTGSLAPGVTVQRGGLSDCSRVDAGIKYQGFFAPDRALHALARQLRRRRAAPGRRDRGPGFYVQAAFYPIKKKLELYAATSQIFGDDDAGFDDSSEYLLGLNFYPIDTRNHRLNLQVGRRQRLAGLEHLRLLRGRPRRHHLGRRRSRSTSERPAAEEDTICNDAVRRSQRTPSWPRRA